MKLELIQPFINAADAVLGHSLGCQTRISDITMRPERYLRHGAAAVVNMRGEIEGRIIFDLEHPAADRIAATLSGTSQPQDSVEEIICELANQVVGNAVTTLNDQGFRFKVQPPQVHREACGSGITEDTEALVMSFETPSGCLFMNIALRYKRAGVAAAD